MSGTVTLSWWLFLPIVLFAAISALEKVMLPSVRWYLRRRAERVVARLNERLEQPIQPFKLMRRHDMILRLTYDPEVIRAVADHARETGVREDVAFHQANAYAREIVPSFSASLYFGLAIRLAKGLSTALYRVRLGHYAEAALAGIDRDAAVVFVMNHRSNLDYVLVTWLAAERSALSYAVGEWARVWPLSRLIKAMGAYFIRRRSRDALYRKVLARYVRLATEGGVTQAVFPEGGLSLTGAPAEPRMGILKYIVEGHDAAVRDVVFVPVALNYDRVLEDRVLIGAARAGERRFAARLPVILGFFARMLWLRLRGRFHRFGYAAVSFGAPVSLRAFTGSVADLAQLLMARIAAEVPVLPVPLVALALLQSAAPVDRAALGDRVAALMAMLPNAHVHLPRGEIGYCIDVGLRGMILRRLVAEGPDGFAPVAGQRDVLEFYAGSIRHLLPRPAAPDSATAKEISASAGS